MNLLSVIMRLLLTLSRQRRYRKREVSSPGKDICPCRLVLPPSQSHHALHDFFPGKVSRLFPVKFTHNYSHLISPYFVFYFFNYPRYYYSSNADANFRSLEELVPHVDAIPKRHKVSFYLNIITSMQSVKNKKQKKLRKFHILIFN